MASVFGREKPQSSTAIPPVITLSSRLAARLSVLGTVGLGVSVISHSYPDERHSASAVLEAAPESKRSGDNPAQEIANATRHAPWENSLNMKFAPVTITGGTAAERVLFSVWETRVGDFAQFVRETGYNMNKGEPCSTIESSGKGRWIAKPAGGNWRNPRFPPQAKQTEMHPVVCVSWEDATAFCKWLTQREQKARRLGASWTYRLPTDHEWSCAVGIGRKESRNHTPEQKNWRIRGVFPWGTQWPPRAESGNYAGSESHIGVTAGHTWNSIRNYRDPWPRTAPVGRPKVNEFGLSDLGGNVSEWCADKYQPNNPWRVLRGGSWHYGEPAYLLSSCRDVAKPARRTAYFGFRIVLGRRKPG